MPLSLSVPDPLVSKAFKRALHQNVLACLGPEVFEWYWYICADKRGFGDGCVWPGLDGHQMGHALLWAGHLAENFGYWEYVREWQQPDGRVFNGVNTKAGTGAPASGAVAKPAWCLGSSTWIKHGYDLFRFSQDEAWLEANFPSIDAAARWLHAQTGSNGLIGRSAYYFDCPARYEFDGITQGYVYLNYLQAAELAEHAGATVRAEQLRSKADQLREAFSRHFWRGDHCAEYIHPQRGAIDLHGLTDVDWMAQAAGLLDQKADEILWQRLARSEELYYGIMPTGTSASPELHKDWERPAGHLHDRPFTDCAAMGRCWYIEAMARYRRGDGEGLLDTIRRVATVGQRSGWFWRERYYRLNMPPGPARETILTTVRSDKWGSADVFEDLGVAGARTQTYAEYPANLVRICCQWLAGVDLAVDGTLVLAPCAPEEFFDNKFGLEATLLERPVKICYHRDGVTGTIGPGPAWRIYLRPGCWPRLAGVAARVEAEGKQLPVSEVGEMLTWQIPAATKPQTFSCTTQTG